MGEEVFGCKDCIHIFGYEWQMQCWCDEKKEDVSPYDPPCDEFKWGKGEEK